jgi:mRNA-degrading endonuclease RelE of RelBE toxin-antitoxin system
MPFELRYSREAVQDLRDLRAREQAAVVHQVEAVLAVNPTLVGRSKVKRLRQPAPADYRLRVGELRVFYNVQQMTVRVVRVLSKEDASSYLGGRS